MQAILPRVMQGEKREWVWPARVVRVGKVCLVEPVRRGNYQKALRVHRFNM